MDVRTTGELARDGIGPSAIRRMVRQGELQRIRRGHYVAAREPDAIARHRQLLRATLPTHDATAVVSHYTAAVLHGMPVRTEALAKVWITRNSAGGGHTSRYLHELKAPLRDTDVTIVEGYRVTTPARTAIDIARTGSLPHGLAAADRAMALGTSREELLEQVEAWPRRPGNASARIVARLADPRAESFGESYSRLVIWQLGFPAPQLQVVLRARGRSYRSDFGWLEFGLLGEFDGRVKYREFLRPGQSVEDAVIAEHDREQDLRWLGWHVARWDMTKLGRRQEFKAFLDGAFRYAANRPAPRLIG
jgi:hypothetical protein